jgi:hypothetical protein
MGSTATQSTFTLYLDGEKNGAKTYHVYLKELNGNSLTLTTGRTGAKDLTISTGTYVLIIYVDENGNINEQGTTATDVVVQGNTQPVTSDAVATAIQQGSDIYATKEYVNDVVSYSTDEQPTGGTWIDGKPIYRKVLVTTTAFTLTDSWINIVPYCGNPTLDMRDLISTSNTLETGAFMKKNGPNSIIWGRQGSFISVPVGTAFIIEYTKTTD